MDTSGTSRAGASEEPIDTLLERPRAWFSNFLGLGAYFATRRAVLDAAQAGTLTAQSLSPQLGPWTFNLYESALAVAPAIAVAKVIDFVAPHKPPALDPSEVGEIPARIDEILPSVVEVIYPFLIPITLLALSAIAARAALLKSDRTPDRIRKSRDMYLYLDGSVGLLPQAIIVLLFTTDSALADRGVDMGLPWALLLLGIYTACVVWLTHVTLVRIPKRLLTANGYNPGRARFFGWGKNRENPLYNSYQVKMSLSGLVIGWSLLIIFTEVSRMVAYTLAAIQLWTQHFL